MMSTNTNANAKMVIFVLKGGTLYPHKNCNDKVNQIKLYELTVLLLDQLDMKFPGPWAFRLRLITKLLISQYI